MNSSAPELHRLPHVRPGLRKPHRAYRHEAFLYETDQEFLVGTVPFVREGVALRQPVMVAMHPTRLGQMRAALGPDGDAVVFVDMSRLGGNPARIVSIWRDFVDAHAGPRRPVRGIGEPVWEGRRPPELVECHLHDALLNAAIEPDLPLWLRCSYDLGVLDAQAVEAAAQSHPAVVRGGIIRPSTAYAGACYSESLFRSRPPAPAAEPDCVAFGPNDLADARARVARRAEDSGLRPDRVHALVLATSELLLNSVRHGGGWGILRIWCEGGALVCEVMDRGYIEDPLTGCRRPSPTQQRGRGMWLANQLCDLVQVRSAPEGTAVRIWTWV